MALQNVVASLDVERDRGLVEHQQVRVGHDCDGEAHPLGLAARQLLRPLVRNVGEPGEREHVVDGERLGIERRGEGHELADGELPDQRPGLEHGADRAGGDGIGRVHAEQRHRPPIGSQQPEQHVDGRRFPGAVRAEDGNGLAGCNVDVDTAHRTDVTKRLLETGQGDTGRVLGESAEVMTRSCTGTGGATSRQRDQFAMTNVISRPGRSERSGGASLSG